MQTSKILEALYLPTYAKAGIDAPEASDLMPDRYRRPRKSVASEIMQAIENGEAIANQFKAMMGANR